MRKKANLLYIGFFFLLTAFVLIGNNFMDFIDQTGLLISNTFLGIVCYISFYIISKGIQNKNTSAFMNAKYAGTMIKFFACILVLGLYIFINKDHLEKFNVFILLGFYLVYTILEAAILSVWARKPGA
ncbi:MAG TPA: hypothetical protein VK027_00625 [Chitinophagaceae bacterium]|nr:hypothetical protein [Chitinophagaceae bacterium]